MTKPEWSEGQPLRGSKRLFAHVIINDHKINFSSLFRSISGAFEDIIFLASYYPIITNERSAAEYSRCSSVFIKRTL
ncbi:hypothetical protein [Nitrincola sp. MINF-07-Sa-05]|uniref:hypothetical protein n=1 Tax=Nitrincola salilacus TaxID=3400273 RepID=UPI00391853FB